MTSVFNCNTSSLINPNPFFNQVSLDYDEVSGLLDIRFFDPVIRFSPSGAPLPGGIPPLPPGCGPDERACGTTGHFIFNLDDYCPPTVDCRGGGGWTRDVNPGLFPPGPINVFVTEVQVVPEPSTVLLLGSALVFLSSGRVKARGAHRLPLTIN